ncbi:DUF2946 domain-containing protein [Serratia sp. TSA_130.2]|uniref:DUF2946 domain-containing protein n=1 Tax=Serratia TaxID=613 RepID=UPI0009081CC8|nr:MULTISPECIES: DUF2946 domain-containing protein [Serratia]MBH3078179.1 DUF2946 domain-containing protein [Serratia sp. JKS000199]MBH3186713.1 DUF2946 domain-containing protein [Serratia sp. JKS000199]PKR40953.1 DUF2946 domain-containing protein [Serratia ureilytica]BCZ57709.1 hypothetical protein SL267_23260 [Serratia marcescens]
MFAILMLFIAPVVSRSLEHARAGSAETTVMADCGMAMPKPKPMHHDMHSPPAAPEKAASPMMQHGGGHHNMAMMMDDSACGYCVLLLHAPLLDVSHAPLFWSQSLASRPPPTHYLVPLFAHVVHTELQPRAPPVSFL